MPKFESSTKSNIKVPSFTSIGNGGGGGNHHHNDKPQIESDEHRKNEKITNKRHHRLHKRHQQQKHQSEKHQQKELNSKQLKVTQNVEKTDVITTTTTNTSSPSRASHMLGKSPVRMAISGGVSGGSPLSLGVHRSSNKAGGSDNRGGGVDNSGGQQQNYSALQQSLQWPPPPYHPFYSKAASYQYRNQAHQSKVEFTDVRQMESTLYQLLTDFHLGKLQAFGDGVTFENMIKVREQQENLARLHFELNLQQSNKHSFENDAFFSDLPSKMNSIISKPFSKSNMLKLIQNLQNLCKSIERLQWKNSNELEFI